MFDNFPLDFIESLVEKPGERPVALGIDARTRGFSPDKILQQVERSNARLVFIACDDHVLQRRFNETRRRHPMARDKSVRAGIEAEHKMLDSLRGHADLVIDTTDLSIHDLRHIVEGHFNTVLDQKLAITLMSFGFKYGPPREADIVMDVRFLKNPHWVKSLKPLTGKDEEVGDYIRQDEGYEDFLQNFKNLIAPLLPRYKREGKSYLTIAIGCTGGRHRSVFLTETLAKWIKTLEFPVHIDHRDIEY